MSLSQRIRTETILLIAGLALLGYFLGGVLLLVLAAILLAVGLDGLARVIARYAHIPRAVALIGIGVAIASSLAGAVVISATRLVQQFWQVGETVADFAGRLQTWFAENGASGMVEEINNQDGSAGAFAGHVLTYGLSAVSAVASVIVLLVLTSFLVANPALYRRGFVLLVPPARRALIEDTLSTTADALRWWFLGQLVSMAILGTTVGVLLFGLGIELWFALAVLTGLLTFVPFLGPIVATVPIVAVAFAEDTRTGLIVLIVYFIVQNIQGNLIEPMIQQKAVNMPPALMIAVQVLLTIVFGLAGLMLAAPLTIIAMIAVQKLYIEHTLGETVV